MWAARKSYSCFQIARYNRLKFSQMASNPPGKCCATGTWHEGQPKGEYKELFSVDTYVTGTAPIEDKVIVFLTDIFGYKKVNSLLVADELAQHGYKVIIPDILFKDPFIEKGSETLQTWLTRHGTEKTKPLITDYLLSLKQKHNPKFVCLLGYCFGAKYAIQQVGTDQCLGDVVAVAHPSAVTMEEVSALTKPLLISAAETDPIFSDELRHKTEDQLKKMGATYELSVFGGCSHGYAVRGDLTIPTVKYARDKTILDQIHWFDYFYQRKHCK